MNKHKITILTDPIPYKKYYFREHLKRIILTIAKLFFQKKTGRFSSYRGHSAVTRSLIEGFKKCKINYIYNPITIKKVTDFVIVLSGPHTLEQCIELKRQGIIKKIFAGPNIVIFSSDQNNLIAQDEIDFVITPSEITNQLYILDNPILKNKIYAWPAGVDMQYWKPSNSNRNKILIYEKQSKGPVCSIQPFYNYIVSLGFEVDVVVYGNYTLDSYRDKLQEAILMIGFVREESQGIAWAEAWASDVPLFLWNNNFNEYRGRRYFCTPAPYLTIENGIFFEDFSDFKIKFHNWIIGQYHFEPLKWCQHNMSDEASALKLMKIIEQC